MGSCLSLPAAQESTQSGESRLEVLAGGLGVIYHGVLEDARAEKGRDLTPEEKQRISFGFAQSTRRTHQEYYQKQSVAKFYKDNSDAIGALGQKAMEAKGSYLTPQELGGIVFDLYQKSPRK